MKAASSPLITLLNSGADFQSADLWTITLSGGTVVRWSGADVALTSGGQTFALGPLITRGQIAEKRGVEVATLQMTIDAGSSDTINGVSLIQFIAGRGFDGANIRLDRAFFPNWGDPVTGTVLRFSGRVTSIDDISGSTAVVTVSSWTILLNTSVPTNLYSSACLHTVYDTGCNLNPATFASSGTVAGSASVFGFGSSLTGNASRWSQGRVVFTSGVNSGLSVAVKSNDGSGNFVLIQPLPVAPALGDTFTAYPGCDLTQGTCLAKFNNLGRFRGTPYVPTPETAL
jgi:uncharacterized phage protein (TIGR02218 family)